MRLWAFSQRKDAIASLNKDKLFWLYTHHLNEKFREAGEPPSQVPNLEVLKKSEPGKYPDLEDRLYEIRKAKYVERCDVSEAKLDELLVSKDSPNVSYNVAKYYLETHGKKRGYSKSAESVQPPNDEIINLRIENAKLQAENERMKLNGSESKTGEKHCGSE